MFSISTAFCGLVSRVVLMSVLMLLREAVSVFRAEAIIIVFDLVIGLLKLEHVMDMQSNEMRPQGSRE